MTELLEKVNGVIWGVPLVLLILGCGICLTIVTGFVQIRLLPEALKCFWRQFSGRKKSDGNSSYRALCTALSATVGTGNVAGVAGAISLGGPGAVFWMWVFAFFGMAVKYAEATLAVKYRRKSKDGTFLGGPMYIIDMVLCRRFHFLAVLYSFFGVAAAFGVGNATQINTVITGINGICSSYNNGIDTWLNLLIGVLLAVFIGISLCGGAKRIGAVTEILIPFACVGYILLCVIALQWGRIGFVMKQIVEGAFTPGAVTSGMIGSAFIALRIGASRGLFTNEAGMGTAAIAHAAAEVEHPVQQGLFGIIEVFLDTIVICTLTALVILTSGIPIEYGVDTGLSLTLQAFSYVFGTWIQVPITVFLCLFAVATVLGWGLYGTMCATYLFGSKALKVFIWLQMVVVVLGAVLRTQTVWLLSEAVNGLMAIPNVVALIALCPELVRLTKDYKNTPSPIKRRGKIQEIGESVCKPAEVS